MAVAKKPTENCFKYGLDWQVEATTLMRDGIIPVDFWGSLKIYSTKNFHQSLLIKFPHSWQFGFEDDID